jgi:hypothetical protein
VEGIPSQGLLRNTLGNGALVYPGQGGRYRAKGCMHGTGVEIAMQLTIPLGNQAATPLYIGIPCAWGSVDGDLTFFPILGGLLFGDSGRHT